jgi:hypothetical protein
MMGGGHIRTLVWNETRASLPTWLACVVTASVAALTRGDVHQVSQFAFSAATIALGAQSIGHEYVHRTLDLTLMLPIGRRRLFLVKLAVAAAMVGPLAVGASMLGLFAKVPTLPPWLIVAIALCLAPTLTMLCRSQLAGTIFSMSVSWIVLIAVLVVTDAPWGSGDSDPAVLALWLRMVVAVLAGSAVLGWWLFMRLESTGGAPGIHVNWSTRTRRVVVPRHPLWQLLKKECRLQQMTFAVTALYVAACTMAAVCHLPGPGPNVSFIGAATVVYALGVSALTGSLATAEERQLGTLAWQLQLPIPVWQQWAVKTVTAFSLSLLLSSGLPVLLVSVFWPSEGASVDMSPIFPIVTTAVSMYASSVCATAVRAAVTSVVAVPLSLRVILLVGLFRGRAGTFVLLPAGVVLLLVFAFFNHRPEQPTASRVARQTLSIAALVAVGLVIASAARS